MRKYYKKDKDVNCVVCKLDFKSIASNAKYCSSDCKKTMATSFGATYKRFKCVAEKRNKGFYLTLEQFMIYWDVPCFYCGGEVKNVKLDRVDSSLSYHIDNVVSCCTVCNIGKGSNSPIEYVDHCNRVSNFNLNKNDH